MSASLVGSEMCIRDRYSGSGHGMVVVVWWVACRCTAAVHGKDEPGGAVEVTGGRCGGGVVVKVMVLGVVSGVMDG
eukprot:15464298-Alexandrium_andersonii.AAC.1